MTTNGQNCGEIYFRVHNVESAMVADRQTLICP